MFFNTIIYFNGHCMFYFCPLMEIGNILYFHKILNLCMYLHMGQKNHLALFHIVVNFAESSLQIYFYNFKNSNYLFHIVCYFQCHEYLKINIIVLFIHHYNFAEFQQFHNYIKTIESHHRTKQCTFFV